MTLIPEDQLKELILSYPDLLPARRELLVEFMQSLSPADLAEMVTCEETPAEEVPFIRACCGLPPVDRPLLKSL